MKVETNEELSFMAKPIFDQEIFNYDFLRRFDFQGLFNISNLSYKNYSLNEAQFELTSAAGVLQLLNFSAKYLGHDCNANLKLDISTSVPVLSGNFGIKDYTVAGSFLDGKKYGIRNGQLSFDSVFETNASSFNDMFENMRANVDFKIKDAVFKGWNFGAILQNLVSRETSDGLTPFIYENLQNGEENFALVSGKLSVQDGKYALSDMSFAHDDFDLRLESQGSVSQWTTESLFTLKYNEPSYLPAFSFA